MYTYMYMQYSQVLYHRLRVCELALKLILFSTEQTIQREVIAFVNHDNASFDLVVDEDSLWTG